MILIHGCTINISLIFLIGLGTGLVLQGDRNNKQGKDEDPGVGPSTRNAEDFFPEPKLVNEEWRTTEDDDEDDKFTDVDNFFWDD